MTRKLEDQLKRNREKIIVLYVTLKKPANTSINKLRAKGFFFIDLRIPLT